MKKIDLILISLFILVGCSKNNNNLKEDLVIEEKKVNMSHKMNTNQEEKTIDTEIQSKADYTLVSGYITVSDNYSFVVKPGYSYVKVWVKALPDSSNINCTVRKDSYITGTVIKQFTAKSNKSVEQIMENCSTGAYYISFTSSGKMHGQFSIRVATNLADLNN